MRNIWLDKYGWDDILPEDQIKTWKALAADLHNIRNVSFPRCAYHTNVEETELFIFCDASQHLYGFSVYIRNLVPKVARPNF